MTYHPVVEKIKSLLEEHSAEFEAFEHEPVRTSAEAANVRSGYGLHQGAKSLITKVKESGKGKKFVMFVLQGSKKFDKNKIKQNLGFFDIRFASEIEVGEITSGILPGGVPPFGNLFNLEVFVDQALFGNERIIFNAGDKSYSIAMKSQDYKRIVNPIVTDIIDELE